MNSNIPTQVVAQPTIALVQVPSRTRMSGKASVRSEYTLQTGHTPFLTDPDGLVKAIEAAAK